MGCACITEKDKNKNKNNFKNNNNNNKINFKSKKNKKKNSFSNSNNLSNINNNNNNDNNSLNNKKINDSLNNNNNNEINEINTNINKNNFNKEENNNNNNKSITLNNSLNSTKPEKIIKCNINYNSKIISQQIFSKNNINNLKEKLNKEYFKNNNNKKLNFYYKGKLLNEEEKIENIFSTFNENFDLLSNYNNNENNNDSLTLNMISLTMNNNEDNSLNEENFNSESVEKKSSITNEYYSKLINKLSSFCEEHSNKKLLFICFLCKKSLCELDLEEHKQHKIIKKIDLINLNKELNVVKDEIEENVNSIGLKNNIENNNNNYFFNHSSEIFKDIKNEILKIKNDNDEIIENINKQYRIIDEDFQKNFDNNFPLTLEFIEKINNINNEINDLETFKDENNFIEIYNKAFFIKNEKEKIINNINILKEILNNYKLNLENFKKNKEKLNKILIKSYNLMFNKINEDEKNSFFKDSEIASKNNINNLNSNWFNKSLMSKSSKNGGKPKLNLLNLMSSQNDKKTLLKNIENNYKEKKNLKQSSLNNYNYDINNNNLNFSSSNNLNFDLNNNFENNEINNNNNIKYEIDNKFNEINNNIQNKKNNNKNNNNDFINDIDNNRYETVTENSKSNQETTNNIINSKENLHINPNNLIYSLLYGSEKIIFYNISTGTLNAKDVDLSDTKLKHFETYISHLSFKGKLYISGGFITAKNFFEYDFKKNKFFKLTDMINSHSYHCMLGYKNNIFVISGYKSKKIETFNINNKTWKNLPDLNYSRSYSNSIVINDNLFVFGNINEIVNKTIIEKLNIDFNDEENLKWEIFEINEIIPFYSGMIYDNRNSENLIIVGGKFDDKEESKKDIYNLNIKDLTVNKLNYELDEQEEFNGKMFIPLDENQNNESINESDFSRDENDFNCNKFGLFSEINPCVFYIYNINDCLFERKEFEENVI